MATSGLRPKVLVNFAASIDGKINPAPGLLAGPFTMSRESEDGRRMKELRGRGDAVVVGASNVRADDPALSLSDSERRRRREAGIAEPWRVVVTSRGEGVRPDMKIFDPTLGAGAVVAHTARMPAATRDALGRVARLVELGTETIAIGDLLDWLQASLGVRTVVCEGGGDLCARFFSAQAVDELYLTVVPRILGGARAPTLAAGAGFGPDEIRDARLGAVERIGDELFLRYDFSWS
ncbi:MAG: dihydrofolate reductase family protein [Bacteroidota bacterium]